MELAGADLLAARGGKITLAALGVLSLLAWIYLLRGAGMTGTMEVDRTAGHFMLVAAMWWAMMIAMMTPSAAPVILLYRRVQRHGGRPSRTTSFVGGYFSVWLGFALIAAAFQIWLGQTALISAMAMASTRPWLSAGFMIAAGLYQWSPLKDSCLANCRSPAAFLTRHYRPGRAGAWRSGLVHGAFCVGCCWLLMVLLFVGGVMNLAWIAALTLLVVAEKLLPGGRRIARLSGAALILSGASFLVVRP